ncbi:MAG: TOBE domain-containing protein [Haloarculaceae archaeon]
MEPLPEFDIYLRRDGVEFTGRDVALLEAVAEHGSLNRAAAELGRSYSRAQRRIVELEAGFGDLVDRTRGGPSGGGSSVTERGRALLARYERLRVEFGGVTETTETALPGRVLDRAGRFATVETAAGRLSGLVPAGCERTRLLVRADAVTLHAPSETPEPDATSARNRLAGTVRGIESEEGVHRVRLDVGAASDLEALVTTSSVERLDLEPGTDVVASFKATATRGIPVDVE